MTTDTASKSMWVIPEAIEETPLSILKEQANALTETTKGVLRGDVSVSKSGTRLSMALAIVAPAMDNYRTNILQFSQPISIYPGRFLSEFLNEPAASFGQSVDNIDEFKELLRSVLSSKRVNQVVSALLAQSNTIENG